jgi:CMP-N-acetylneuraminic acid synthetase
MNQRVAAIVPMRHGSERVPGKNYRPLAGRPLYHHIVDRLLESGRVDTVVLDTDSAVILEDAATHFPTVRLLERPSRLGAGDVPMNEVLLHSVAQIDAEFYLQTHSTNPLLQTSTIDRAIERFLDNYPRFDSLFGVTRLQTRLWDALARPINHNSEILLRTQDLPPVYAENSCLYIFTRDVLAARFNRIGRRPLLFEIPPDESWDIDDELNFEIVDFLASRRSGGPA